MRPPITIATFDSPTLLRAIAAASGPALSSALLPQHVAAQLASTAAAADSGDFERQHHFHKTIWKRISAAHGARLSSDQPDVALHGTALCEQPTSDGWQG
jgi:hypothetical protein